MGVRGAVASNNIFIKHVESGRLNQEPLIVTAVIYRDKRRETKTRKGRKTVRRERKDEAEET